MKVPTFVQIDMHAVNVDYIVSVEDAQNGVAVALSTGKELFVLRSDTSEMLQLIEDAVDAMQGKRGL